MNQDRLTLFRQAREAIDHLPVDHPAYPPFESIRNQITALIKMESSQAFTGEQLINIILGYITMREVETREEKAADLFYRVSTEAKIILAHVDIA